ncbi:hypothetical protein BSPWISOX_948 [uncultured Gammaproteobacteria bacterium]|nr:hypothetical protein BSPWISOX_948 [uncultured Gammaproteobacteria bacterium]
MSVVVTLGLALVGVVEASGRVSVFGFLVLNMRSCINDKIKHYK